MTEYQTAPHTFVKAGIFYFNRKVPKDLQAHYSSRRVAFSLRTRAKSVAASRAQRAAQKLDEYWYHLRLQQNDLPGKHLLRDQGRGGESLQQISVQPESDKVEVSEAVAIYLRLKGQDRPDTFKRSAERSCGYLIDTCGIKDITGYTRKGTVRRGARAGEGDQDVRVRKLIADFVTEEIPASFRSCGEGPQSGLPAGGARGTYQPFRIARHAAAQLP